MDVKRYISDTNIWLSQTYYQIQAPGECLDSLRQVNVCDDQMTENEVYPVSKDSKPPVVQFQSRETVETL